ncbi:hypothetical protein Glove_166g256 [Diversispora epigaea]|uniref:Uncharacterized protein n=1 Tax=Diversispora epigaea TaxID=1348612 RepID=A0A397IQM7_9GLOM|nr:hypothetical protein Glove_166g256 [Diversispora epigaea]
MSTKTQGLTLARMFLVLDGNIFLLGQEYVALGQYQKYISQIDNNTRNYETFLQYCLLALYCYKGDSDDILGSEDDILGSEFSICYTNRQFGEEDLEDCGKYWDFYWDDILGSEDDILGSEDDILGSEFSICYINCQFGEEDLEDYGKY